MTTESETRTAQDRELVVMLGLLVGGLTLMYLGRATFLYYGSYLTAGIGGIAIGIGGGDPGIALEAIRREPTLVEEVLCFAGAGAIILNTVFIMTGGSSD